jgi:hypothetical protein
MYACGGEPGLAGQLLLAAGTYGRGAWEILLQPWGSVATAIADGDARMGSAIRGPITSVVPPGANGTTIVIGRVG